MKTQISKPVRGKASYTKEYKQEALDEIPFLVAECDVAKAEEEETCLALGRLTS
jgi:hypothetical protein